MSARRKRAAPPPEPPVHPQARAALDWSDTQARAAWLASVRITVDDLLRAAGTMLQPPYDWISERHALSLKVIAARDRLQQLLHAGGAYPVACPVPELNYCGRCGSGPFDGRACPDCGETDDLPRWPHGAHRG